MFISCVFELHSIVRLWFKGLGSDNMGSNLTGSPPSSGSMRALQASAPSSAQPLQLILYPFLSVLPFYDLWFCLTLKGKSAKLEDWVSLRGTLNIAVQIDKLQFKTGFMLMRTAKLQYRCRKQSNPKAPMSQVTEACLVLLTTPTMAWPLKDIIISHNDK